MPHNQQFADYRSYNDIDSARQQLLHILDSNNIPYQVETTKAEMDVYTGKASWIPAVVVKIPLTSFEQANLLTEQEATFISIPPNHYLISFTDTELMEIIQKQDEWGMDNYNIARKILADRGHTLTREKLDALKKERIAALAKPEKLEQAWLYAAFASAVAGGVPGIISGHIIYTSTKVLPNGQRVYTYNTETRKNGQIVYRIGIGALLFYVVVAALITFAENT